MNSVSRILERSTDRELAEVVEPLADLVCASEKPEVILRSILTVLHRRIQATNNLASAHYANQRGLCQAV